MRNTARGLLGQGSHQQSAFTPGTSPLGNSQSYTANDLALLVVDDPDKLVRMASLWSLPQGRLVDLPPEGFLDSLSPGEFRDLPLVDVGYGSDWIDETDPSGRVNRGFVGDAGFRAIANLTPTGLSAERIVTSQNQQKDLEGICYGDSGSSAFTRDDDTGEVTIFALPTWVNDGGTKCHSTVQWLRLDRPNAPDRLSRALRERAADEGLVRAGGGAGAGAVAGPDRGRVVGAGPGC